MEEENCAAVKEVYRSMDASNRVRYVWFPGDHDFPPHARKEAVEWLKRWLR
jgi:predicted esterase